MAKQSPTQASSAHLGQRTAVLLIFAVLCGIGAGLLVCAGGGHWAIAVLTGGGVFGGAFGFFDRLIA